MATLEAGTTLEVATNRDHHTENSVEILPEGIRCINAHETRRSTAIYGLFKEKECGLAWCIVLSTMICVITVVKMLWTHEA